MNPAVNPGIRWQHGKKNRGGIPLDAEAAMKRLRVVNLLIAR
jgi:hypothetical protein